MATTASPTFEGFDPATITFFEGLHADNSKAYFEANRETYETFVREPMQRLLASFEGVFGPWKMFRPNRDLRFTDDKRPYKESVAGTVGVGGGVRGVGSRYVHLTKDVFFVGGGLYRMDKGTLTQYRKVVDDEGHGEALRAILDELEAQGYAIGGKELANGPRDYPKDHPRIELLKHKGVVMSRRWGIEDWLFTPEAADRVARVFADAVPLNAWLTTHLEGYADERRRR